MNNMRTAIYPGSFDPFTYGHIDIIERASGIFDKVIVGVSSNSTSTGKKSFFSGAEKMEMFSKIMKKDNVEIKAIKGLLVDFVKENNTNIVVRGMRAVSDFDYEFKMNLVNSRMMPGLETVFLMASEPYQFLSSSFVIEIARLGGDISSFVPPEIEEKVKAKLKK